MFAGNVNAAPLAFSPNSFKVSMDAWSAKPSAITYAGILAYRDTVTQILGAPAGFAQSMAFEALSNVTQLMQDEGIDKIDDALNPAALLGTADSMNFGSLSELVPTMLDYLGKEE